MKYFWGTLALVALLLLIAGAFELLRGAFRTVAALVGGVLGVIVVIALIALIRKLIRK